ncbi:hypothetical protein Tco_1434130 [Tanacetum coccineum]
MISIGKSRSVNSVSSAKVILCSDSHDVESYHLDDVDVVDVLSAFLDITMALLEDIMDKLVRPSTKS